MKKLLSVSGMLLLLVVAFALFNRTDRVDSAGYIGFPVHIQTATTTTVGPQFRTTLFADQPNAECKSRVITTAQNGIMLSFDDVTGFGSTTLTSVVGHLQPASTTVAYDSGVYGCGLFTALGLIASTTVTTSQF